MQLRAHAISVFGLFLFGWALPGFLGAQTDAQRTPRASNMDLVGYDDLQARSAYQPVIQKQGARWIAYIGHHGGEQPNPLTGKTEPNGTSIVDVTDPKHPRYLFHIPGEPKDPTPKARAAAHPWCACAAATNCRTPRRASFTCCAISARARMRCGTSPIPAHPSRINVIVSGLRDTHKSWWECDTGIAYLVSGVVGWRVNRMAQIYDLSDPTKPVFIRNFGLPGQQPGAKGPTPGGLHGPISTGPKGNRVYFAYDNARDGVIEIVDREKLLNGPKEPTEENLRYPVIVARRSAGRYGRAHHVPHAADAALGVRKTEIQQSERFYAAHRRNHSERMPGEPADGAPFRHHD